MKLVLSTIMTGLLVASVAVQAKQTEPTSSFFSIGFTAFDSAKIEGLNAQLETNIIDLPETDLWGEHAILYAGAHYLSGNDNKADSNADLTATEVYSGIKALVAEDTWLFIEEGLLQQKRTSQSNFVRTSSDTFRLGVEHVFFKELLPAKANKQKPGINVRLAYEKYNHSAEQYEGYRIDVGYRGPVSIFYRNDFSGDESVFGVNFTANF